MKDDTAYELHVIVNHIPCNPIAAGRPAVEPHRLIRFAILTRTNLHEIVRSRKLTVKVVCRNLDLRILGEPSRSGFHYCKCLRKNLAESRFYILVNFLHEFVRLRREFFLLLDRKIPIKLRLDFRNPLLVVGDTRCNKGLEFLRFRSEFVVRQFVNVFVCRKNLVEKRFYRLHVPLSLGSEEFLENVC